MHLSIRALLIILFLIAALKSYTYLNSFSQPWIQYVSYLIPLLTLILITNRSHKIIKEFRKIKALRQFEQINTKARWLSVLSSPDQLQYLMKNQRSIDMLIYKVKIAKQAIYNRTKFSNLMQKYIETLNQKLQHQINQQNRSLINKQLKVASKQLQVCFLIIDSQFSYNMVQKMFQLPRQKYLQTILQLPLSTEQKRQLISTNFSFIINYIPVFLKSYFELSPFPVEKYIHPLMFTPQQVYQIESAKNNQRINHNQSKLFHQILSTLISQFKNYSISFSILNELIRVQERQPTPKQKQLLFYLKLLSIEVYQNFKLDLNYKNINKTEKYSLFKNVFDTLGSQQIRTIKYTFDLLDDKLFPSYLIKYIFNSYDSQLNIKQIINLFNQNYIESNQSNILYLIKQLKLKTVSQCHNYDQIVDIVTPFIYNKQVNQFITLFKYCKILDTFSISTPISIVQQLWLSENQKLQEKALSIFRDMIKSFSINRMKTRYLDLDGHQLDLHVHQSIIKLSLYLKKHFFKRLLTEQTMFQMIFQHLIHFGRYGILVSLLREQIMQKYIIDYTMIQIVVIEQIHTIFDTSDNYNKIEQDIERLIGVLHIQTSDKIGINSGVKNVVGVLTADTPQKNGIKALVQVAKLIKKNRVSITPSTIIKNMNVKLLYTIVDKKISIQISQIHKIYKQILIYKNPHIQPNTETKEYRKFKAWLAKKYYQIDLKSQGLQILRQLSEFKMAQLCNTIIQIIKAFPDSANDLLDLGYQQVISAQQFNFFMKKFTESKSKPKQIKDFYFKESQFISNDKIYSDLVAECRFIDDKLKNPIFQTFFVLLGNNHKQAFYNAYKKRLPLNQLQFFLKEAVKKNIIQQRKIVPWLYKTLLAKNESMVFGEQTSYSQFIQQISPEMVQQGGKYYQKFEKLKNKQQIDKLEKDMLKRYHSMTQIRVHVSDQFLLKYFDSKQIVRFMEDKAFRKKQITQLSSRIEQQDVITLSKLAKIQQINLLELIIFNICGYLNTEKIPSNIEQYLINTTLLTGKTKEGADQLIQKIVSKVFSTRILLSLIYGLMKLKDNFWKNYFKDKYGLRILQTLAAVEQSSEFYGLLPNDIFTKQIKPQFVQQTLPLKKVNILNNCLKLSNIFVVSKAMYLLHGFSSSIQKQVFKILCDKSPEAAQKLSKLLS